MSTSLRGLTSQDVLSAVNWRLGVASPSSKFDEATLRELESDDSQAWGSILEILSDDDLRYAVSDLLSKFPDLTLPATLTSRLA